MAFPETPRAAPSRPGNGSRKADRLAGAINQQTSRPRPRTQRNNRDLITAAVARSTSNSAMADAMRAAIESAQLTRAQQLRLQKVTDDIDRVTRADRSFFERFPERRHRVRLATAAEVTQFEIIHEGRAQLPPGCWLHVVVRQLAPGRRLRTFIPGPYGAPDDEELAREIFEAEAKRSLPGGLKAWLPDEAQR